MNPSNDVLADMTLDPPGRIAVVGAGALGIEAALYGRYLGYEVDVYERGDIGQSWRMDEDAVLPILPGRCLSPLAIAALGAQDGGIVWPGDPAFPLTIGQWIRSGLTRLANTDLLLGRIHTRCEVVGIECIEVESLPPESPETEDDDSYVEGEVPPDYRLTIRAVEGMQAADAEAVIIAVGESSTDAISGYQRLTGSPYLFAITPSIEADDENRLLQGWRDIVAVYALLGGRQTLDLYRPTRS